MCHFHDAQCRMYGAPELSRHGLPLVCNCNIKSDDVIGYTSDSNNLLIKHCLSITHYPIHVLLGQNIGTSAVNVILRIFSFSKSKNSILEVTRKDFAKTLIWLVNYKSHTTKACAVCRLFLQKNLAAKRTVFWTIQTWSPNTDCIWRPGSGDRQVHLYWSVGPNIIEGRCGISINISQFRVCFQIQYWSIGAWLILNLPQGLCHQ